MTDISCKKWRMNNLYRIIDKDSNSIPFRLKPCQEYVLDNLHNRNIILKARQLGFSTFAILYDLDEILFSDNLKGGIVSYSLEHAQHIFKKIIGHALDTMHPSFNISRMILQRSAREITLSNGSSVRVDTTVRGGTCPLVLVSEFGKTCARNPQKAEEVVTGTLQAVPKNGRVIIESTAEGNDGYFADMVMTAHQRGNENLSPLEYKLFFFAWFTEPSYSMDEPIKLDVEMTDYFINIEKEAQIKLTAGQKNWYAFQKKILKEKMLQEYPSTVAEAFLSSSDAFYFAEGIAKAYKENRCVSINIYDALLPVYVAMDIGVNDLTVIVFFQLCHGEIRIFDYYEDKNKDVPFYANYLLTDKRLTYHTIFLPHDAANSNNLDIQNSWERDFRRLFSGTNTRFHVLTRTDKQMQISHARIKLDRCVFNISRVKKFLDNVAKYRKIWSEATGKYLDKPLHSIASNYGDALQYTAAAVQHLEALGGAAGALEKHRKVTGNRNRMLS